MVIECVNMNSRGSYGNESVIGSFISLLHFSLAKRGLHSGDRLFFLAGGDHISSH